MDARRCAGQSFAVQDQLGRQGGEVTEPGVATTRCIGCGGLIPSMEGPTHRYMESSPGCWHFFGEVLAREYSDPSFAAVHRLTVDSYAVQHPGQPSPQSIQSVCVHLMSLCLVLERGVEAGYATRAIQEAVRREDRYVWLTPPPSLGSVTVADVVPMSTPSEHQKEVRTWARSAWSAWAEHHETVRRWLPET